MIYYMNHIIYITIFIYSIGTHDWVALRQSVQDYIKGLNFGYRVALREAGVVYLNKLG